MVRYWCGVGLNKKAIKTLGWLTFTDPEVQKVISTIEEVLTVASSKSAPVLSSTSASCVLID